MGRYDLHRRPNGAVKFYSPTRTGDGNGLISIRYFLTLRSRLSLTDFDIVKPIEKI